MARTYFVSQIQNGDGFFGKLSGIERVHLQELHEVAEGESPTTTSCWLTIPPHRYGGADRCKQKE
jgi:hypothetical protein